MGFFVNGMLGRYGALMSELYPTKARATGGRAKPGLCPETVATESDLTLFVK